MIQSWTTLLLACILATVVLWPRWAPWVTRFWHYWYARNILKGPSSFVHELHVTKSQRVVRLGKNEFSITDPALISTIYGDQAFLKSEQYAAFDVDGEASIFSMRDPGEHKRRVKAVRHMFKVSEIERKAAVLDDTIARTLKTLDSSVAPAEEFNVLALMRGFAVETISIFALGLRYPQQETLSVMDVGRSIGLVLDDINQSAAFGISEARMFQYYKVCCDTAQAWLKTLKIVSAGPELNPQLLAAYDTYNTFCKQVAETTHDSADYKTNLELLNLSPKTLQTEIADLLFAGTDSTATTLSTALWFIYTDPKILENLRDDLDYVEDAQLSSRPYLNAIIDEALRLAQPVPRRLPRVVPRDKDIFYAEDKNNDGWHKILPTGATVGIAAYSLHRDPVFIRPNEFIPERWLSKDTSERERMRQCLIPFGRGHRACIGQELARCEMRLLIRRLVDRFDGDALGVRPEFVDNFNASIVSSSVRIRFRSR